MQFEASPHKSAYEVALSHRRVLAIEGPDAAAFLQAQLTAEVVQLKAGHWCLAGYCSAKGRLLANGFLWPTANGFRWLVADDLAAALVKRLRMFVLRAKVTIDIDPVLVIGIAGVHPSAAPAHVAVGAVDQLGDETRLVSTWLGLTPVDGMARAFGLVPDVHIDAFLARTGLGQENERAHWDWLEVRSGIGFIEAATQDRFVPQMINLEALGGVDFKKGCYPGQEVVARSQYLGKLKRRTLLAHTIADATPKAGSDVLDEKTAQPVGTVVSSAKVPSGGTDLLIEAPLTAWDQGLVLAMPEGAQLERLELPYALPDNEVFVRPRL